jgi:hypothetical protein
MKARLLVCTLVFLAVISLLHVQLNVGWDTLAEEWESLFDPQRRTLMVGFLPVT